MYCLKRKPCAGKNLPLLNPTVRIPNEKIRGLFDTTRSTALKMNANKKEPADSTLPMLALRYVDDLAKLKVML